MKLMESMSNSDQEVSQEKKSCLKEQKQIQYKIKYTLNRLPLFSTQKQYLIDALLHTREEEVFRT